VRKRIAIATYVESGHRVAISDKFGGKGKFQIEFCQFLWNSLLATGAWTECDIVAYGTPEALRDLPDEHVVKVPYYADSYWSFRSYAFGKSVDCIKAMPGVLRDYEFVLRSDTDVFLTPHWRRLLDHAPAPGQLLCGNGAHCNGDVPQRIEAFARECGLLHEGRQFQHRLGSTFFGRTDEVVAMCGTTVDVLLKILESFGDTEGRWPEWYRGVALLYAGEIAINWHFPEAADFTTVKFDGPTTASEPMPENWAHLHCWHTDNQFSKFWFYNDKYKRPAGGEAFYGSDSRVAANAYAMDIAFQVRE